MNKTIVLNLGENPPRVLETLPRIPDLQLIHTGVTPYIKVGAKRWNLKILKEVPDDIKLAGGGRDTLPFIVQSFISAKMRRALEEDQMSYADGHGRIHLVAPGLFIHIEGSGHNDAPRSKGLGVASVRAVQILLVDHEREWTVTGLAREAGISAGQAQNVFQLLEKHDFVVACGSGPRKRRLIREPGSLLDWLTSQPASGRRPRSLKCNLYAPTPKKLWQRAASAFNDASIEYAFSGATAAAILGAGPTAIPLNLIRVNPQRPLPSVVEALEAGSVERGANIVLWSDVGKLGTYAEQIQDGFNVAPVPRIYLDLFSEHRGEDVAEHFRDTILDY